jgi:hypothetical protein
MAIFNSYVSLPEGNHDYPSVPTTKHGRHGRSIDPTSTVEVALLMGHSELFSACDLNQRVETQLPEKWLEK